MPSNCQRHSTDSFDSETSRHAAGFEVHRDEVPHFFDLVAAGTAVEADDAANDPKTSEVYRLTMAAQAASRLLPSTGSLNSPLTKRKIHCSGCTLLQNSTCVISAFSTTCGGVVESQLLSMLSSGQVPAALVAKQLGMSEQSLRRQLAQERTSFGEVLDRLRHGLALRYLEDEQVSLQQIGWLLGYSEIGAFNHAFKRWTGTSPSRMRKPAGR